MLEKLCIGTAVLMGIAAGANGLFMLWSPEDWYFLVPGVTTTGPFNQHFLRDIGLIFVFVGAAFLAGAAKPHYRVMLWAAPTLWLASHALFHVWEVVVGICAPSDLVRDFPVVTLPALLGALLTLWAARDMQMSRAIRTVQAATRAKHLN